MSNILPEEEFKQQMREKIEYYQSHNEDEVRNDVYERWGYKVLNKTNRIVIISKERIIPLINTFRSHSVEEIYQTQIKDASKQMAIVEPYKSMMEQKYKEELSKSKDRIQKLGDYEVYNLVVDRFPRGGKLWGIEENDYCNFVEQNIEDEVKQELEVRKKVASIPADRIEEYVHLKYRQHVLRAEIEEKVSTDEMEVGISSIRNLDRDEMKLKDRLSFILEAALNRHDDGMNPLVLYSAPGALMGVAINLMTNVINGQSVSFDNIPINGLIIGGLVGLVIGLAQISRVFYAQLKKFLEEVEKDDKTIEKMKAAGVYDKLKDFFQANKTTDELENDSKGRL